MVIPYIKQVLVLVLIYTSSSLLSKLMDEDLRWINFETDTKEYELLFTGFPTFCPSCFGRGQEWTDEWW